MFCTTGVCGVGVVRRSSMLLSVNAHSSGSMNAAKSGSCRAPRDGWWGVLVRPRLLLVLLVLLLLPAGAGAGCCCRCSPAADSAPGPAAPWLTSAAAAVVGPCGPCPAVLHGAAAVGCWAGGACAELDPSKLPAGLLWVELVQERPSSSRLDLWCPGDDLGTLVEISEGSMSVLSAAVKSISCRSRSSVSSSNSGIFYIIFIFLYFYIFLFFWGTPGQEILVGGGLPGHRCTPKT